MVAVVPVTIVYSHTAGIHTARLESKAANLGPLLASARRTATWEGNPGWVVNNMRPGPAYHQWYALDEEDAVALLELIARELAS